MSGQSHKSRLAEWAALVGASVPETTGCERPCDRDGDT